MNVSTYAKHEQTILIVNELKRNFFKQSKRSKVISNKPGFTSEEMYEYAVKEAIKRGLKNPRRRIRSVQGFYTNRTEFGDKLIKFEKKFFRYAFSNPKISKSSEIDVIPNAFITYNRLKRYSKEWFSYFLKEVIKNKDVTANDYESLAKYHEELEKEIENIAEVEDFLDTMENLEKYRDKKMKEFVKKNFDNFVIE